MNKRMRLRRGRHILYKWGKRFIVNIVGYAHPPYGGNSLRRQYMKRVIVFFIVGIVFFGACSAQNANAQNANNEQRIIGTWVNNGSEEGTLVFNANGNLTVSGDDDDDDWFLRRRGQYKFAVTDTHLAILRTGGEASVYSISISSDGRTLIIYYIYDGRSYGFWFTKR